MAPGPLAAPCPSPSRPALPEKATLPGAPGAATRPLNMVTTNATIPNGETPDAADVDRWLSVFTDSRSSEELARIREACGLLLAAGENHGEGASPAYRQIFAVADTLLRMELDWETPVAALLYHLQMLDPIPGQQLQARFGEGVARMVQDMSRIGAMAFGLQPAGHAEQSESEHAENVRRMMLGIADDIRVVLIVLAERLQFMRDLKQAPEPIQQCEARETREIYAPLANRLGIWQIKWELEDLSLRYLQPEEYQEVARQLDGRRADRERFIGSVIELLQEKFREAGVEAEVTGRPKHIYSIWRKMKRKAVDIDQIFDLRAVRVLVNTIADCYAALGVVHGIWRHIPGEFDDYIATPKANMYRSIHTAVIGPGDKTLEIQIRTHEMHRHSELGVAAHWRYKESSRADAEFERRITLMRNWLEAKGEGDEAEAGELADDLKAGFEDQRVYVFTPNGKVVELPRGATPVDFAYAIHSSVGHRCRGARIDGNIAPLTQALESGQTVEILTGKEEGPSRDWLSPHLGYLKTSKARNRVRHWFKHQDYEEHLNIGRASLEREIIRLNVSRPDLEKAARRFNFQKPDDLLAAIGRGDVSPVQVAGMGVSRRPETPEAERAQPLPLRRPGAGRRSGEVVIEGVDDLMTHMAGCCKPVPYDDIVGFITRGRGVTVHRRDCPVVRHLKPEERARLVAAVWADQPGDASYPVDIRVLAGDRKGLLRDISTVFTNEEVDVTGVNTQTDRRMDQASMRFTIEIRDMRQLSRVLDKIAQLPGVNDVRRQG